LNKSLGSDALASPFDEAKAIVSDEFCKMSNKFHNKKTLALLSPAGASFDQFNSYKHRSIEAKFYEFSSKFRLIHKTLSLRRYNSST